MSKEKKIRILIAEDDFLVAKQVQHSLAHLSGYEIVGVAGNGQKTIEMVVSLKPDILLLDIQMPQLDGLDVAKKIQTICPTPIVILTAYESKEFLEKASEAGVGAYLTKPPDPMLLERSIWIAMARHQDLLRMSHLCDELKAKNEKLQKTLSELKILQGILPICANCKKIRDDQGSWKPIENYIEEHSDAEFSHGICPDCMRKLYPEYAEGILQENNGSKTRKMYLKRNKDSLDQKKF